jgi:hypothetical protein
MARDYSNAIFGLYEMKGSEMQKQKITILLFTVLTFLITPTFSAVHYVSSDGTATWEQSVNINTPCSLPTANANVGAGDTVCLKEGTYNGDYIKPNQTGESDKPIVYSNYNTDSVVITDADYGILIDGKSYIVVQGINFYYMGHFLYIRNNANHNTIAYCIFDQCRDTNTWGGSKVFYTSQYNHVHHCTFSRWGYANDSGHAGALFDVGREAETTDSSYYNLIEDNTFYYGGHHCLAAWSQFSIFRNNYLHHERSPVDGFGYRCAITHGKAVDRNLYEGNRFAFAYKASGMSLRSSNNLFRRNVFYYNGLGGIQCVSMEDYTPAHYNRIYNNVFFHNGHEADYSGFSGGIYFCDWGQGDPKGNVVKNNIFYDNKGGPITTDAVTDPQVVENNWETGDPLFMDDESPVAPFNPNLPDFHLKKESPCIDSGTYITKITSASGSGTQFQVEDAGFFIDGWGMIEGDLIQLEDSVQKARITDVDYDNNTITVDNSITWTQNMGIHLAYSGSAPDLGAYEYTGGVSIENPHDKTSMANPRITIYPNSTKGRIYTLAGGLVDELQSRDGKYLLNINTVSSGMFVIRFNEGRRQLSHRFLLLR